VKKFFLPCSGLNIKNTQYSIKRASVEEKVFLKVLKPVNNIYVAERPSSLSFHKMTSVFQ
jgi:hypothetical protein